MAQEITGIMTDASPFWSGYFPFPSGAKTPAVPDTQKMMMMVPHMHAALLKTVIDQQRSLFGFLQERCDEDMKLAQKISSAASMGEVIAASLSFCQEAAVHYATQARRAAEIGSQGTIEVTHDLQQEREEILATAQQAQAA